MSTLLKISGIGASKHKSREFAALLLYFSGKNNTEQLIYAFLTCEIHLVKNLKANLLIGNDIISPKGFVINVKGRSALIRSCKVTVPIDIRQREQFLTGSCSQVRRPCFPLSQKPWSCLFPCSCPTTMTSCSTRLPRLT